MSDTYTEISTSERIALSSNTWKENAAASVDEVTPAVAYVSLYDLIQGKKLMHSAFVYESDLYSVTTFEATKTDTREFNTFGIDIGVPIYDDRSLTEKIKIPDAIASAFTPLTEGSSHYIYVPRSTDVIRPSYVDEFFSSSILKRSGNTKTSTSYSASWLSRYTANFKSAADSDNLYSYNSIPLGVIESDVPTSSDPTLCILKSSENTVLEKTYLASVYDRLKLNLLSTKTLQSVVDLSDVTKSKSIEITSSKSGYFIDIFLRFVFSHFDHLPSLKDSGDCPLFNNAPEVNLAAVINANIDNEEVVALLKKLYVWVKAPFLADYVDAESFGQELNKESNVVHKNLLITGSGDFTRLDNASDKYDNSTKPKHLFFETPIKDFISSEYYDSTAYVTDTSIDALMTTMSELSFDDIHDIGEPLLEARSHKTDYSNDNDANAILDLGYYNPDLVSVYNTKFGQYHSTLADEIKADYTQSEAAVRYRFNNIAKPRIVPKSGNLWVDGRIFSPTINELWYVIKKLISGRGIDATPTDTSLQTINESNDSVKNISNINQHYNRAANGVDARPTTKKSYLASYVDTRLNDIETSNYAFSYGNDTVIYGDPIDIHYETKDEDNDGFSYDEDIIAATVTSYVTQPDRNELFVLPYFADRLKKRRDYSLKASGIYNILPKDLIKVGHDELADAQSRYDYPVVDLTTYNSEADGTESIVEGYNDPNFAESVLTYPGSRWSPREYPMSLRELEANILSNRMNIESIVEWIDNDIAAVGAYQYMNPLGSSYDNNRQSEAEIEVQSMLFMLHKDYNHQFVNPNTTFNLYHVDSETAEDSRGKTYYKQTTTELKTYNKANDEYSDIPVVENFGTNITLRRYAEEDELNDIYGKAREKWHKLPVFARNYGVEVKDSQYEFNLNDVVMTADGTWQYLHTYTRLPTLREVF